jgi:hypothetical protein
VGEETRVSRSRGAEDGQKRLDMRSTAGRRKVASLLAGSVVIVCAATVFSLAASRAVVAPTVLSFFDNGAREVVGFSLDPLGCHGMCSSAGSSPDKGTMDL